MILLKYINIRHLLLLLIYIPSYLFAQNAGVQVVLNNTNSRTKLSSFTQHELDSLSLSLIPSGFIGINNTTNCINYYINNNWYQLCGECIPKAPKAPIVDSISIKGDEVNIKFKATENLPLNTELHVVIFPEKTLQNTTNHKVSFSNLSDGEHYIEYYYETKCGQGIKGTTDSFLIKSITKCGVSSMEINAKNISISSFENACWFTTDLGKIDGVSAKDVFVSNNVYYYNSKILNNKNACPAGWHIPTEKEANTLQTYISSNEAKMAVFNPSLVGSYSPKEKVLNVGKSNAYWLKGNKTEKVMVVTKVGIMNVDVSKQDIYTTVRCVKD